MATRRLRLVTGEGPLIVLIRHLGGGLAAIVGHSLSGGAATIAAATAPDLVSGIVEVCPFTRKVEYSLGGMLRVGRYRRGALLMAGVALARSLKMWMGYLDLAYPEKPADYATPLPAILLGTSATVMGPVDVDVTRLEIS